MSHYLLILPDLPGQVWKIEDDIAVRVGVNNPERGPNTYFKADPGQTIWETLRHRVSAWFEPNDECRFHKTILGPGEFYPRMARPIDQHPEDARGRSPSERAETDFIAISRGQLTTLARHLDRICQTVQPTPRAFGTLGHDIRNLLILAAPKPKPIGAGCWWPTG